MITVMNSLDKHMSEDDNGFDSQLWHACAGRMVKMPPVNSKVFYFPQGHAEHAYEDVDFGYFPRIQPLILCRVSSIRYLADTETDEVYAKLKLVPLSDSDCDFDDDDELLGLGDNIGNQEKHNSFAKTLTQSDANNGGGFSVPRYCAETIFPRLDYTAEPPVQNILAKDVHGEIWQFRHIYRGTPRRHLLTTGWSNFVNQKKLVARDSVVFFRADSGDLYVGIRRAKKGIGNGAGLQLSPGWNIGAGDSSSLYGAFPGFLWEDKNTIVRNGNSGSGNCDKGLKERGKVSAESVIEAATLAANRQPFEVVYYPRANTPEYCVKASAVRAAMRTQWYSGMRFKMAFETEDSSRISWFMGTISSVQVGDPIHWPNSPWRLLQVVWEEPDLLQNVKCVSPWLVELVSNTSAMQQLSPFSSPIKKLRLPQPSEHPLDGQFTMPPPVRNLLRSSNPLGCVTEDIPAGIQGARHAQIGLSSSELHFDKLQLSLFPYELQQLEHAAPRSRIPSRSFIDNPKNDESIPCLLTLGNSIRSLKRKEDLQSPVFFLFGQPILTEHQICPGDAVENNSTDGNSEKMGNLSDGSGSAVIQNGPPESSSDEGFPSNKDKA